MSKKAKVEKFFDIDPPYTQDPPQPIGRLHLDQFCDNETCQCCGKPFSKEMPFSFGNPCHKYAPLEISYWDGILSLHCAECGMGVVRIRVSKELI